MFSWSSTRRRTAGHGAVPSAYPAERTVAAPTIPDSIRPPGAASFTRVQHLDSYLKDETLQKSTRKVSADDSTYDTVFQTSAGVILILRVHFVGNASAPSMTLAGVKARHAWLDARHKVIGCATIQSDEAWKRSHVLLGTAVHQVVQHFQLHPPEILEFTDDGLRAIQPKQPAQSSLNNGSHNSASRSTRVNGHHAMTDAPPAYDTVLSGSNSSMDISGTLDSNLPSIPSHFAELDDLSREELEELLNDELAFLAFVNRLPITQELYTVSRSVVEENWEQAQANLQQQDELMALHKSVTGLQSQLKQTVTQYQRLQARQQELCAPPDHRQLLRDLAKAKKQAFDESERVADGWLERDNGDVAEFCDAFSQQRQLHHLRAAKMELLERRKTV